LPLSLPRSLQTVRSVLGDPQPPRYLQTTINDTIVSKGSPQLPAGWVELVDAMSGSNFYLHKESGRCVFDVSRICKAPPRESERVLHTSSAKKTTPWMVKKAVVTPPKEKEANTVGLSAASASFDYSDSVDIIPASINLDEDEDAEPISQMPVGYGVEDDDDMTSSGDLKRKFEEVNVDDN
jgi:hypothetical protein